MIVQMQLLEEPAVASWHAHVHKLEEHAAGGFRAAAVYVLP